MNKEKTMDFNSMIEKLTWKKIVIVTLIAVFGIWLLREVMLWTFFHEARQVFSQFNTQFEQQQKQIHNKIAESESDFDKRQKAFNESFDKTHQLIEESRQQFQETMAELDRQALEREKKFNEAFAKAPQQMFDQHKAMSERMFNEFKAESRRQSNDFRNHVMNLGETSEEDRCRTVLGDWSNNTPSKFNSKQSKEKFNSVMRMRKEIAKAEHCEAYL